MSTYGLGAMAITGGGFHAPDLIAAWPSGEFGPMGLEGAVRLGFRRELEAAPDAVITGPAPQRVSVAGCGPLVINAGQAHPDWNTNHRRHHEINRR